MVEITVVFDFVALLGFLAAAGLGTRNYVDAELEKGFWGAFSFASVVGACWTGSVLLEWLGVAPSLMDPMSFALMSATTGVFAVTATGTLSAVEDLKDAQATAERSRTEAEEAREEAEIARTEAEAAREEAEALTDALETKAEAYGSVMQRAADGDLTARVDTESRSEAMTRIGTAFNAMLDDLEATLRRIQGFTDDVARNTDHVSSSAEEIQSASEDVSESVQEISAGVHRVDDTGGWGSHYPDASLLPWGVARKSHGSVCFLQARGGDTGGHRSHQALLRGLIRPLAFHELLALAPYLLG